MKESSRPQDSRGKSFPRVSTLGFLIFAVWIIGVGGIVIVAWGDAMGWLAVAAGLAIAALYATGRFQRSIAGLGESRSYPTRVFIANILLIAIAGDRKSTRLNSSHVRLSRMPSSA